MGTEDSPELNYSESRSTCPFQSGVYSGTDLHRNNNPVMSDHILLHLPLLLSSVNSQDWLVAVVPSGGGRGGRVYLLFLFWSGVPPATPQLSMCIQSHKLSGLRQAFLNNSIYIIIKPIFSQPWAGLESNARIFRSFSSLSVGSS